MSGNELLAAIWSIERETGLPRSTRRHQALADASRVVLRHASGSPQRVLDDSLDHLLALMQDADMSFGAYLAVLGGVLVENGASATSLCRVVVPLFARVTHYAARFALTVLPKSWGGGMNRRVDRAAWRSGRDGLMRGRFLASPMWTLAVSLRGSNSTNGSWGPSLASYGAEKAELWQTLMRGCVNRSIRSFNVQASVRLSGWRWRQI
jgi:hypothetical protein